MSLKTKRDAGTAWIEKTNPLRGLSIREAQQIFDSARAGDTQRLHWIFQEIEAANPVLMTCVERRAAALAGIDYGVNVIPSADQVLGDEQKDAVSQFIAGIENFDEMVEHLDLAFFRGFSYAQPLWEADNTVRRIELLDSWQFLTKDGVLYFNPACDGFGKNCEEVTREAGLIGIKRRRAIDYPALSIHIRSAVGERDWGRFLERIALPKPAVMMAANATKEEQADYLSAAEEVEDGKVSVWPNGTSLTDFMGGSRGQDPFSGFIRHQEEKIVLLSTGGTLTSLAQADTGSLAGGAQMDVWREIVGRDAVAAQGAIMRALVIPYLTRAFPGQKVCVDFAYDRTKKLTAKESADVAVALRNAGFTVVKEELEEATGFTLEKAPDQPAAQTIPGMAFAKAKAGDETSPSRHDEDDILAAFAQDTGPAAEAIREFLKAPGKDAAEALMERLPDLIPDDPAMAAVIAEEMAKAIADELGKTETAAAKITNPCPKCHKQMGDDNVCSACAKRAANHNAGKTAWEKAVSNKADVLDAMERDSIGKIDFIWGKEGDPNNEFKGGEGVSHVLAKHKKDAGMITGVLAYGDVLEDIAAQKYYVIKKRNMVVLRKRPGKNSYVITGFKKDDPNTVADIRKRCKLVEKGE